MEPHRLRRWKFLDSNAPQHIYTCARPGRSKGRVGSVKDELVLTWLNGLPSKKKALSIISMLGEKPDGTSEWSFYSFSGADEFQEWIESKSERDIAVSTYPTTDFQKVEEGTAKDMLVKVKDEIRKGRAVLIIDSGGEQRTKQVCKMMGLKEDSTAWG